MSNSKYKYRLKELFIAHFGSSTTDMRKLFIQQHNICMNTLIRDFNSQLHDSHQIPAKRLKEYAVFLNTYPECLRNKLHQTLAA